MSAQDGKEVARRRVPQAERPVVGRGNKALAIRAESDLTDLARVPLQGRNGLPGPAVPKTYGLVHRSRGDARLVGANGDGPGRVRVAWGGGDRFSRGQVPKAQSTFRISTARNEMPAIRTETKAIYPVAM